MVCRSMHGSYVTMLCAVVVGPAVGWRAVGGYCQACWDLCRSLEECWDMCLGTVFPKHRSFPALFQLQEHCHCLVLIRSEVTPLPSRHVYRDQGCSLMHKERLYKAWTQDLDSDLLVSVLRLNSFHTNIRFSDISQNSAILLTSVVIAIQFAIFIFNTFKGVKWGICGCTKPGVLN